MNEPLKLLPGETPDEIDLELWHLGDVMDAEAAARIADAAEGPLAPALAELEDLREFWASARPGLVEAPPVPWWRRHGRTLALAAAAVLALGTALWFAAPSEDGVRPMGTALALDLVAERDGDTLSTPYHLRAGDQLFVAIRAPEDGFVDVVTLQDDGLVSPLVVGALVEEGERFALDGAARLDEHEGREWLILTITPERRDETQVPQAMRTLLPDPGTAVGPHIAVVEITRRPVR